MEIASFLKLFNHSDGFGFGFFMFGCFSQFFNLIILSLLLVLGFKFLHVKVPPSLSYPEKTADEIKSCNSLDHRDCNSNNGLDQSNVTDSTDGLRCSYSLENLEECDDEEESRGNEDQVFDVITLRNMVKRESKRGDLMKIDLEKERRAAASASEEAMAMLLRLQMEKNAVEMEAKQYKRVAEQKQLYDQEVIQSLQFMLMKYEEEEED